MRRFPNRLAISARMTEFSRRIPAADFPRLRRDSQAALHGRTCDECRQGAGDMREFLDPHQSKISKPGRLAHF